MAGSRPGIRLGVLCIGLLPFFSSSGQTAAKTLSEDFKVVTIIKGSADTAIVTGRAIGGPERMRIDVTTSGSNPKISPITSTGKVGLLVSDSGKTISYIDDQKQQYFSVRPAEMIQQAQTMGAMKLEFSETRATVDSLGAGPAILGHPTVHYRVATGMTMNMAAMGQQQAVKVSNNADYYFATDIKGVLNPFASLSGGDMVNMLGGSSKEFVQKMKTVQDKLPKGTPLRATSSSTVEARGETRVIDTQAEVTAIKWIPVDPRTLEIPSTYTSVQVPGMGGSSGGTIPPR
jgi:hypothetical protein